MLVALSESGYCDIYQRVSTMPVETRSHANWKPWPVPFAPMQRLHCDYCGPFLGKYYALVLEDSYSKFPEVFLTSNATADFTKEVLQRFLQEKELRKSYWRITDLTLLLSIFSHGWGQLDAIWLLLLRGIHNRTGWRKILSVLWRLLYELILPTISRTWETALIIFWCSIGMLHIPLPPRVQPCYSKEGICVRLPTWILLRFSFTEEITLDHVRVWFSDLLEVVCLQSWTEKMDRYIAGTATKSISLLPNPVTRPIKNCHQ